MNRNTIRTLFAGAFILLALASQGSYAQSVAVERIANVTVDTGSWLATVERSARGSQCTLGGARTCYEMYVHVQNASDQDLTCRSTLSYDDNSVTRSATLRETNIVVARGSRAMSSTPNAAAYLGSDIRCTPQAVASTDPVEPPAVTPTPTAGAITLSNVQMAGSIRLDGAPDFDHVASFRVTNSTATATKRLYAVLIVTPTIDGTRGYQVGRAALGAVPANTQTTFSGRIGQYVFPPRGTYYEYLLLVEEGSDRYIARMPFRTPQTATNYPQLGDGVTRNWGSGVEYGKLGIQGPSRMRTQGQQVTISVGAVRNRRPTTTSELYLNLVAFPSEDAPSGQVVAKVAIGALPGEGYRLDINETVALSPPPAGTYHMKLMLTEGTSTEVLAKLEYAGTATFTAAPAAPTTPPATPPAPPAAAASSASGGGGSNDVLTTMLLAVIALLARMRKGVGVPPAPRAARR
jgi:hypothetical protein